MQESLGGLLVRLRAEQGISQLRLAERLCAAASQPTITRHEISRWEREERIPTDHWLGWLAEVLGAPLTELERAAWVARRARHPTQVAAFAWVRIEPGVYRRAS